MSRQRWRAARPMTIAAGRSRRLYSSAQSCRTRKTTSSDSSVVSRPTVRRYAANPAAAPRSRMPRARPSLA
ncbi:MAG: hypothetical protein IJ493_12060 [Clostridia bacterium]|nr:hypothetical protein [Clostridia bacterium]